MPATGVLHLFRPGRTLAVRKFDCAAEQGVHGIVTELFGEAVPQRSPPDVPAKASHEVDDLIARITRTLQPWPTASLRPKGGGMESEGTGIYRQRRGRPQRPANGATAMRVWGWAQGAQMGSPDEAQPVGIIA